ncbi:hypothetical protein CCUS01_12900 [Colletotrichum cuscutae]|uniref:C2H2-type domain-containing protein n=1 Tax=Colletotrichum cuscutae TaxID=1209917 RepID=A0AAI9YCW6_9PEZI|nr:hypothetical protein CCUS01_12900 [Colletotrichum cuscutae]
MQSDLQSASKLLLASEPTKTDAIENSITSPQIITSSESQPVTGNPAFLMLAGLASRNLDFQELVFDDSKLPMLAQQNDDRDVSQPPEPNIQSIVPLLEPQTNSDAESVASGITWTSFLGDDIPYDNLAGTAGDLLFPVDESIQAEGRDNIFEEGEVEELSFQPLPPSPMQDAPFTDSGYASGINLDEPPRMELRGAATTDYDRGYLDTMNVSSENSTVAKDQAQQYIFELSSTIHDNLAGNIDADNWRLLAERVLGLIKDFAIQIGLESSAQVNRDIMHFIHKYSREVATRLDSMILSVGASAEDAGESIEAKRDHVLLSDKMALWISKTTGKEISVNDDELFVGVTDVEETIDAPELSKYNKTITESDSFKWLTQSLRRELTLKRYFDASEGCNHREMIHRKIIENLPSGKISKNQPPTTHSVIFRVPGWALLRRLEMDRYEFEGYLYKAVIVTNCSGDAQAAMIEDYMEQTWPSTWRPIFKLLQTVSCGPSGNVYAGKLLFWAGKELWSEHGILMMSLYGPAHTIAECGEQLAWLRASYANPPPQHGMSITAQRIPVIMKMATLHGRLWFDIGVEKPLRDDFALSGQSRWTDLLGNNNVVMVPGYPILRRPNAFNGIEVSPGCLMESLGPVSRSASTAGGRTLDFEEIQRGRHIIGQCQGFCLDEDSSEELEPLADDDPIWAVVETVVFHLVSGFRYAAGGEVPLCGNGQDHGTVSSSYSRGIAASSRPAGKGRKRKQVQDDKSDSEGDATHPRPSKRSRETQQHIKLLACPFGKMSPSKYPACSRFQLKRIRDVKQHLKRKHTPDDYCNRCLSIFDDEESLMQHVSQPDGFECQLPPKGRTLDGISHRQSRDLSRKANAELSEEKQWFAIWDIVFPQKPRPESAYLDSALAMQVCLFREHCARHAEPLLVQNLRAAGLLDEGRVAADQEQLLRRVISESLDSFCDTFSTNGSSDSGIGRNRNLTRNETPAASLVDSGIGIGSHFQPRTASFATASVSQQNIRPVPTDVPADFQILGSEERAVLGSQSFASLHQPGALGQSFTANFPLDHDLPSVEHRPDELGMFDFNLSTALPPLELSSWTFPQTELIPHEEGAENAL